MQPATYVGPDECLRGKTALVRRNPALPDLLFAQFDDVSLVLNGALLGYRWHAFPATNFVTHPRVDFEEPTL